MANLLVGFLFGQKSFSIFQFVPQNHGLVCNPRYLLRKVFFRVNLYRVNINLFQIIENAFVYNPVDVFVAPEVKEGIFDMNHFEYPAAFELATWVSSNQEKGRQIQSLQKEKAYFHPFLQFFNYLTQHPDNNGYFGL